MASHSCSVVRPKERRPDVQNPFMRGHTIIRSKTFSPGPQSQYICRVRAAPDGAADPDRRGSSLTLMSLQINRSDSDSSTLSKKSPFVRNASERRSMRMKKVCGYGGLSGIQDGVFCLDATGLRLSCFDGVWSQMILLSLVL